MDEDVFGTGEPIVGMVHLPPLPGAPRFGGDRAALEARAVTDAETLAAGGVDGVLVENFGDAPFHPDDVPKHVVATMTDLVGAVDRAVDVPVGVNVLRNDAEAAVAVAAATGARFVRVNVHAGARVTDQGVLEGRAAETMRLRDRLGADVRVFADVAVKHSAPLGPERPLAERARDLVERGLADVVVVSGERTGEGVAQSRLAAVVDALGGATRDVPVFAGSGVTAGTVADLLSTADGAIVGSAFEEEGLAGNPVDETRVRELVGSAREPGR